MSWRRAGEGFRFFESIDRIFVTRGCRETLVVSRLHVVVNRHDGEKPR